MTLEPTFALTPRSSYFYSASDNLALAHVFGVSLLSKYSDGYRNSFDNQHAEDEAFFYGGTAADPSVDYSSWSNRRLVPHVMLFINLTSFGAQKELALVFGFDATSGSRLLIYSDAGQLSDETLAVGDNQFLLEIESLETYLSLYFIHASEAGSDYGGNWFFQGVTGYVI